MHSLPLRVYYEDTDVGGVVYYANYLKYLERGRTEFLRDAGFNQSALANEISRQFVVRSVQLDLIAPARLDDTLTVETGVADYRRASMVFDQQVMRHTKGQPAQLLCAASIRVACVNTETLRPVAMPEDIKQALEKAKKP